MIHPVSLVQPSFFSNTCNSTKRTPSQYHRKKGVNSLHINILVWLSFIMEAKQEKIIMIEVPYGITEKAVF